MPNTTPKHHGPARPVTLESIVRAWLGSALAIGIIAGLASLTFAGSDHVLLIGSFGASGVLLFAAPSSPFAQPRNLFGGHLLSALIGVTSQLLFSGHPLLAPIFAVSTAIAAMQVTRTLHPPGGATALIAVIGGTSIHHLGYGFLVPILIGVTILFLCALLSQNLFAETRHYPEFWW